MTRDPRAPTSRSSTATCAARSRQLRTIYRRPASGRSASCPIVFRDDALGLLVLYHRDGLRVVDRRDRRWPGRSATTWRPPSATPGWPSRRRTLADRLRVDLRAGRPAEPDPGRRGHRPGDRRRGAPADRVRHDPRLPRRPRAGMCEPIAFQGTFIGVADPAPENLRGRDRRGPDRLGRRAQARPCGSGDAAADPRGVDRRVEADEPESMLVVPMIYEDAVHGVIVVSRLGRDRFDADDETTLTIFAGYAAQALVNAANLRRLAAPAGRARAPARRASAGCSRSTSGCSRRSSRPASSTSSPTRSRRSSRTTR